MTLRSEERDAIVNYRKERALKTLQEAKDNARLGHWNLVANRLYYSMYYACIALLIANGVSAMTHAGVKSLISMHYIKKGLLSQEDNSLLNKLFSMRQTGGYDDIMDWSEMDVSPLIPETENFLNKILGFI